MAIYILKVNLSLILFYLCYKLLFQRDTFWMLRRFYLLASILFSFIYPLISVEGWIKKQEPIMTAIASIQLDEFVITANQTEKLTFFTLENVLWAVFGFVVLLLLIRFFIQLFSIFKRRIQGEKIILQNIPVIRLMEKIMPFSFFRWIFINPLLHTQTETAEILEHEQTHVRQWHSIDVIIAQVQTILCWFNPAAWLLEREIRFNLEFLADNQVIKSGFEPKKYQYHLLRLTYEPADSKLGNEFSVLPIKKRIKMMNTRKTKKMGLLKYALIVPIAIVMLLLSNMQEMIAATKTFVAKVVTQEDNPVISSNVATLNLDAELNLDAKIEHQNSEIAKFTEPKIVKNEDVKIQGIEEEPPTFPGGVSELYKWLGKNIIYPKEAQEKGIQGNVYVKFVVTEKGKITQTKILRGVDPILDAEAIRVVSAMPDWIPGKKDGQIASMNYTLPIQFKLMNNESETATTKKESDTDIAKSSDNDILLSVDTPPTFPGGIEALYRWLSENMKYPDISNEIGVSGQIFVQFIVDENGKVTEPKIFSSTFKEDNNKTKNKEITSEDIEKGKKALEDEAIRVVSALPNFNPGKHEGKVVKVKYNLPIQFTLQ